MRVVRKPNRRYLFYRAYCTTTVAAWLGDGVYILSAMGKDEWGEQAVYGMFVLLGLLPFALPAFLLS